MAAGTRGSSSPAPGPRSCTTTGGLDRVHGEHGRLRSSLRPKVSAASSASRIHRRVRRRCAPGARPATVRASPAETSHSGRGSTCTELQRPGPAADRAGAVPVVVRHARSSDHHVTDRGDHVRVAGNTHPTRSGHRVQQQPVLCPGRPPDVVLVVRRESTPTRTWSTVGTGCADRGTAGSSRFPTGCAIPWQSRTTKNRSHQPSRDRTLRDRQPYAEAGVVVMRQLRARPR